MDKESLLKKAREALENERFDETFEILEEILQEGVDVAALELKGEAFRLQGEPKEAMKCYDRALVVDLNQKAIWKGKGICLMAVGREDEARRSMDRAVKIDPGYVDGWLERGRMGMKAHDWEMALESFEKVTELESSNDAGWFNKANALITGFGRMDEALECYKTAINLNGDYDEYWFSLGVAQKSMKDFIEAGRSFNRALALKPLHIMANKYFTDCIKELRAAGIDESELTLYPGWKTRPEDEKSSRRKRRSRTEKEEEILEDVDFQEPEETAEPEEEEISEEGWGDAWEIEEVRESRRMRRKRRENGTEAVGPIKDAADEWGTEENDVEGAESKEENENWEPEGMEEKPKQSRRSRKRVEAEPDTWDDEKEEEHEEWGTEKDRGGERRGRKSRRSRRKADEDEGESITVDCPRCEREIELNVKEFPARLECPYCGATGTVG